MTDLARLRLLDPGAMREELGDGNYGGYYVRGDDDMLGIWEVAVEETRTVLTEPWG
jgi:creatinine amidohydrolase